MKNYLLVATNFPDTGPSTRVLRGRNIRGLLDMLLTKFQIGVPLKDNTTSRLVPLVFQCHSLSLTGSTLVIYSPLVRLLIQVSDLLTIPQPRDTCYVADEGLTVLKYSGHQPHAHSWDEFPVLKDILKAVRVVPR
jgi:hypothetical protein